MYDRDEPSALFHGLHRVHQRRVMEEQARRGVGELNAPMLLLGVFQAERTGQRWSQRDAAKVLRLSPATVAVSLKTLERDGYVRRAADEHDQRRNRVSVTDKGKAAVEKCGESFRAVDEQMLSGFTPEEKSQLTAFLKRMIDNLGGAGELPCPPPIPKKEDA